MINEVQAHSALFQLTGVGVVQTDMVTGHLVRANQAFCEMVGYSEAELRGMTNADLTHPDDWGRDAESFTALQQGAIQGGTSLTRCVRKDGTVVWLELHITVLPENDGPINIAVVNDVTERKRAEASLKELNETLEQRVTERTEQLTRSEQRFSQAFHSNPISSCMTTFGIETFVEVNDAFLTLTGYERDEVLGRSSRELSMWSSPEDRKKLSEAQHDERGFRNLELKLRTKEGGVKDILISATVIRLDGDDGYLKMFYDITKRKETEEHMHRAIQQVMTDTSWFSHKLMERLTNIRSGDTQKLAIVDLSQRERQVLERMAGGMSNEAIAAELGIAVQTARNYVSTIYDKLGVHSRGEAIIWARERGITGP